MWARTRCSNDAATGKFSCLSGDCGSGQVACLGAGGAPPTTLMEFTLNGADGNDFYDVSNVDGFNAPVSVVATGGTSGCNSAACPVDINAVCPAELMVAAPDGGVVGCKSACLAFNTDEYCCRGAFGGPDTWSLVKVTIDVNVAAQQRTVPSLKNRDSIAISIRAGLGPQRYTGEGILWPMMASWLVDRVLMVAASHNFCASRDWLPAFVVGEAVKWWAANRS
ncbi:hypothetical protein ZIOFF_065639 [Zingiber officinale]|uniref:Thaumatin-like protein n=1 Tax=Zingiber officinale TaxID=94328 RepID=A0A8J5K773_ZINOF|nr:hypothetical protein ZIOFF_065639 [Zingiber officinale]